MSRALKSGNFSKLVLSKIKKVDHNSHPLALFLELNKLHTTTFNYLFSSPKLGCWVGATPELLLETNQEKVNTVSLAGTVLQNEKWTTKEKKEQLFVTEYICDKLKDLDYQNITTIGPDDLQNGVVKHLRTTILADGTNKNHLPLLRALHPTPAT